MHPTTVALMYDQVRAIYRAFTGTDMPEELPAGSAGDPSSPEVEEVPLDEVARCFAELESMARTIPVVVERVPPFSFAPPLDAYEEKGELVLELAVPGVERGDVVVEATDHVIVVSGVRTGERLVNGRSYLHAEIPRGPFHRVIRIPYRITGEPRLNVKGGLIRIHLNKKATVSA